MIMGMIILMPGIWLRLTVPIPSLGSLYAIFRGSPNSGYHGRV